MKKIFKEIAKLDMRNLMNKMRKKAREIQEKIKKKQRKKKTRLGVRPEFTLFKKPKSPAAEAYRMLRTHISFSGAGEEMKTIVITSSGSQEGKSTTVVNLGSAFAQANKKTLIVDADLRNPSFHRLFKLDNATGFSSVIFGQKRLDDAVYRNTLLPNLDVLTSGPKVQNPAEILGSVEAEKLVSRAKALYDIVIFDSPPVLAVTDAKLLSFNADGVIMVIKAAKIAREVAMKARAAIIGENINLIGVVLNDLDLSRADYYYYHRYYYSYSYGKKKKSGVFGIGEKPVKTEYKVEKKPAQAARLIRPASPAKDSLSQIAPEGAGRVEHKPAPAKKKDLFVPGFSGTNAPPVPPPPKVEGSLINLLSREEKKDAEEKKSGDKETAPENSRLGKKTVFFKKPRSIERKKGPGIKRDIENGDGSGLGKKDIFKGI